MDILTHGLWGATILRRRKGVWWAFLAGTVPDLLGSTPAFIYLLTMGKFWGTDTWQYLPQWTREVYHFHHSFLSVVLYGVVVSVAARGYVVLLIPYAFHVLLDGFTHSTDIVNRLLYPTVFDVCIHGLNWWEHGWIVAVNVAALLLINVALVARRHRRNQSVAS